MKSSGGLLVDRPVVHFIQEYRVLSMSSMSSLSMMPKLSRLLLVGMVLCLASCGDSGPAVSDREIPRPLQERLRARDHQGLRAGHPVGSGDPVGQKLGADLEPSIKPTRN